MDSQRIEMIQYQVFRDSGFCDLESFVYGMLRITDHNEKETLYLVMGLVDVFRILRGS